MIAFYILAALLGIVVLYIAFLGVCSLLVNTKREYNTDSPFYRGVLNFAAALILGFGRVRIHLSGVDQIPSDSPVLFVGNHRSNFDPIVTLYAFRKFKPAFISKEENFKIPFFGRVIRKCCYMVIDRENPRNAIVTINRAAALIRDAGMSVGVYPEGTRSKDCTLLPFHNGVFKIAQKANCPIVVVAVQGTEQIHSRFPLHSTDVYLDVLEVLPAEQVKASKTEVIGNCVTQLLEEHLK